MAEPIPIRGRTLPRNRRPGRAPAGPYLYAALRDAIVRAELEPGRAALRERAGRAPRASAGRRSARRSGGCATTAWSRPCPSSAPSSPGSARRPSPTRSSSARRSSARRSGSRRGRQRGRLAAARGEPAPPRSAPARPATSTASTLLDDSFHHKLCDLSGHPAVWTVSERAKAHLNRSGASACRCRDYLERDDRRAPPVVDAVAANDPDPPRRPCAHHLRTVLREVPRIREPNTPTTSRSPDGHHRRTRPHHASRPELYQTMVLIRALRGAEAERQYKAARIGGYCHLASGQEATTVGADRRAGGRRPARHRLPRPRLRAGPRRRRPRR